MLWIPYLTQLFKIQHPVSPQQSQVIIFLSTTVAHTHHKVGQELPESPCLDKSICQPSSCSFTSNKISAAHSKMSDKDEGWTQSRKLAKGYNHLCNTNLEKQKVNRVKAPRMDRAESTPFHLLLFLQSTWVTYCLWKLLCARCHFICSIERRSQIQSCYTEQLMKRMDIIYMCIFH